MIFVVAGVMIVYDLGSTRVGGVVAVRAVDFGHLAIFYVACTVPRRTSNGAPHAATLKPNAPRPVVPAVQAIRATLIGTAYLMMNGLKITHMPTRDFFVAVWGGLRGAVGLALGLLVFKDTTICENIRNKVTAAAHAPSHRPCP